MRTSATQIDSFLQYEAGDLSHAQLMERLQYRGETTESMLAGRALHAALEHAEPGEFAVLERDGFRFELEIDATLDLPPVRELRMEVDIDAGGTTVTLVGIVDTIDGLMVGDHKFTGGFNAERFLRGYQWRVYLVLFGADSFRWNVFAGRKKPKAERTYVVTSFHTMTCYRYPGIEQDVRRVLARFVQFCRDYLPEKFNERKN